MVTSLHHADAGGLDHVMRGLRPSRIRSSAVPGGRLRDIAYRVLAHTRRHFGCGRSLGEDGTPVYCATVMCNRFASYMSPNSLAGVFGTVRPTQCPPPSWNIAPPRRCIVVQRDSQTGIRRLSVQRWGVLDRAEKFKKRRWVTVPAEEIPTSRLLRESLIRRRCIVPADAFYQWESGKNRPYAVARRDGQPMAFAGLWQETWWSNKEMPDVEMLRNFTIVTTAANATLRPLHERMPVVLEKADWPAWLGDAECDPATFLHPAEDYVLRAWSVDPRVGDMGNDDAGLLAPRDDSF